jgi:hypothetical protein
LYTDSAPAAAGLPGGGILVREQRFAAADCLFSIIWRKYNRDRRDSLGKVSAERSFQMTGSA